MADLLLYLEVPHFLRPDHKNLSLEPDKQPFIDRFRVQLKGRPSSTALSLIFQRTVTTTYITRLSSAGV